MPLWPGDLSAILAEQGMAPFFFVSLAHLLPKKERQTKENRAVVLSLPFSRWRSFRCSVYILCLLLLRIFIPCLSRPNVGLDKTSSVRVVFVASSWIVQSKSSLTCNGEKNTRVAGVNSIDKISCSKRAGVMLLEYIFFGGRWNSKWSNDAVGSAGQTPRLVFLFSQSILKSWSNDVPLWQIIGSGQCFNGWESRVEDGFQILCYFSVAMRNEDLPEVRLHPTWIHVNLDSWWFSFFGGEYLPVGSGDWVVGRLVDWMDRWLSLFTLKFVTCQIADLPFGGQTSFSICIICIICSIGNNDFHCYLAIR